MGQVIGALVEYAPGQYGSFVRSNADSYSNEPCARCGGPIGYGGMAKRKGDERIVHFLRDMNRWGFVLDCREGGQHFQTEHLGFDAPKVAQTEQPTGEGVTVTMVASTKSYAPNLRKSAQVFKISGNPEVKGWAGRVRNAHHDHVITDFGPNSRCCERAERLGRHMHMAAQPVVLVDTARYGRQAQPERVSVTLGDVLTIDGADWRVTNVDSLDDPYLLPA